MEAPVDLRSDTVTRPTPAMRRAMAEAEVGDDGYGEDPTVRRLEEAFAARVGKEAALFVPSGTMGNQIALRVLGRPGTAVVAGRRQHVVVYEQGGGGVNGWIQFHTVDDDDGTLDPDEVAELVAAADHHWLPVSVVCVENTHMPAGGAPWPLERMGAVAAAAGDRPVHLDGARCSPRPPGISADHPVPLRHADLRAGADHHHDAGDDRDPDRVQPACSSRSRTSPTPS